MLITMVFVIAQNHLPLQVLANPVKGNHLSVSTLSENIDYKIYNMLGQLVSKGVLSSNKIDVSELENAIYMVEFSDKENKIVKRFIKE